MFDSLGDAGTDAGALLHASEVESWLERLTRTTLHDSTDDTDRTDGTGRAGRPDGSDPVRTETELVEVISGLESLKAAAAAAQATATLALEQATTRRRAHAGITSRRRQEAGLGAQIALARRDAARTGNQHLGFAHALTEMPHTRHALATGTLSEWRATLLIRETACLTREDRTQVDTDLFTDPHTRDTWHTWGTRRITNHARALTYAADPTAVVDRARRARTERRVTCRPAPDTMAYLTALLPAEEAIAAYTSLQRAADTTRGTPTAAGRTRSQLMADTLTTRLTTTSTNTSTNTSGSSDAGASKPGSGVGASEPGSTAGHGTGAGAASPPGSGVGSAEIQLVITDTALFGTSNTAARLTDYGPVPAGWARDLITRLLTTPDTDEAHRDTDPTRVWIRRLYTHPDTGALTAMDSRARTAPTGLARFIRTRDDTCRTPWCDAPIRHTDHITPHAQGGPTTAQNLQGLCEQCNYTKQAPGWHHTTSPPGTDPHTVTITTPTGHTYTSTAPHLPGTSPPNRRPQATPQRTPHPAPIRADIVHGTPIEYAA
ncbi:MAG TPA: HNH endonuclease [Nocardioidaceae bacterium]|nr:HNH endonuclease [Nocardioidaceae bacterium]